MLHKFAGLVRGRGSIASFLGNHEIYLSRKQISSRINRLKSETTDGDAFANLRVRPPTATPSQT